MDKTMLTKVGSAMLFVAAVMILAMTGRIEGAAALDAIKWIGVTFLGGTAAYGGAVVVAKAMTDNKPTSQTTITATTTDATPPSTTASTS